MKTDNEKYQGKPDKFWNKIYFVVLVMAMAVIAALWTFSRYFG